ncbi:pyridoxal phosphate-dependent aminotransferase [Arenibacter sp. GZD96]|uniref:pyridoxal phosphate-dependent aminotransferase n=1 Tax=Aurantibrevibacter litoralis TaxID=3106030 RepID=UPI002AFDF39C|nr:pyridoxal phosphate-dependent aminotransferase [Arenibacter sp. GZD-96]MEA1786865.1 pyridoxal phosphate-dependent aminotransferase [Arenibacter sp. GZD-96]
MPSISRKGQLMPESPIRKLVPFAEQAKKNGIHVIHLNIGQPDIKTPQIALEAVKNNTFEVLEYSRTEGSEIYREKIAAYYKKQDVAITKDEIIVTTGGSEALSFAMASIADPEDEIIVPEPFYANYSGFSVAAGVHIVPISSDFNTNFALPPIADFEKHITKKTKAILICNPGNPTGYLYTKDEIQQLASLVKKHNLFLIADEVYREFVYDNKAHYSILQEKGLNEHAIVVDSVSKRYSMCGARIGYFISRNKDVIQTAIKFAQARLSPPTYALLASEAALDTPQSYFDEVRHAYEERRNILIKALNEIKGVKVARPQGAFYCIVELPVTDADDFAKWLLKDFSHNNETVMVAPAAGFYATPNLGRNQIRIAYVLEKDVLTRAIKILSVALETYNA